MLLDGSDINCNPTENPFLVLFQDIIYIFGTLSSMLLVHFENKFIQYEILNQASKHCLTLCVFPALPLS